MACADVSGTVRVIDGDTLDVGATRVRLHGIDAPEGRQTCTRDDGADWACGRWATRYVRQRYEGKQASCIPLDRDRYGRVVATCSVAGEDLGRTLVANGVAFAYRKYSMAYDLEEKQANIARLGVWAGSAQRPEAFRDTALAPPPADQACVIKGNITQNGRIYHLPGQEHYNRTRISTVKGERWFCSEAEARAAGWRKAGR